MTAQQKDALGNYVLGSELRSLLEIVGRQRMWVQDGGDLLDDEAALVAALLQIPSP